MTVKIQKNYFGFTDGTKKYMPPPRVLEIMDTLDWSLISRAHICLKVGQPVTRPAKVVRGFMFLMVEVEKYMVRLVALALVVLGDADMLGKSRVLLMSDDQSQIRGHCCGYSD